MPQAVARAGALNQRPAQHDRRADPCASWPAIAQLEVMQEILV